VNGLNERGEVVGGLDLPGDQQIHPFLWDGKKLIDLIAPPFGGAANGEAAWINEAGEVVGLAGLPVACPGSPQPAGEVQHAFLWMNGVMTDLGTLPGILNTEANFINSKTQVVGDAFACDFSVFTATLWENGTIVDLNTLVPPHTPLYLFMASFIDDRGQIAAFGRLQNGDMHAVLLIPCDENHPNIEGCDYSLVDAKAATAAQAVSGTRDSKLSAAGEVRGPLFSTRALPVARESTPVDTLATMEFLPRSPLWERACKNIAIRAELLKREPPRTFSHLLGIEGSIAGDYFRAWSGLPIKWKPLKRYPIPSDCSTYRSRVALRHGIRLRAEGGGYN
jgi:probable HAF family extracellular repeat protein